VNIHKSKHEENPLGSPDTDTGTGTGTSKQKTFQTTIFSNSQTIKRRFFHERDTSFKLKNNSKGKILEY